MEMPKPTEVHHKLAKFAGRWTGKEKLSPSPWDPKGGPAVGRCNNRLAADGFILVHDYEQERGGTVNFRGHGVFSYDCAGKCYMLHWWDSMGLGINVCNGALTHSFCYRVGTVVSIECSPKKATHEYCQQNRSERNCGSFASAIW